MSKKINLNTSEKIIPYIKNAEKELRTLCEKRAIELYGEIPAIIVKQLEWEINLLKAYISVRRCKIKATEIKYRTYRVCHRLYEVEYSGRSQYQEIYVCGAI